LIYFKGVLLFYLFQDIMNENGSFTNLDIKEK
jgi:hypothetical protein